MLYYVSLKVTFEFTNFRLHFLVSTAINSMVSVFFHTFNSNCKLSHRYIFVATPYAKIGSIGMITTIVVSLTVYASPNQINGAVTLGWLVLRLKLFGTKNKT